MADLQGFTEGKSRSEPDISAGTATMQDVIELFDLRWGERNEALDETTIHPRHFWSLAEDKSQADMSYWLEYGFHLHSRLCDPDSGSSARIRIHMIILSAMAQTSTAGVLSLENYLRSRHNLTISRVPTNKDTSGSGSASASVDLHTPARLAGVAKKPPNLHVPSEPAGSTECPFVKPKHNARDPSLSALTQPKLMLFPEVSLRKRVGGKMCAGRMAYALGYGDRKRAETFLAVIQATALNGVGIEAAFTQTCFCLGMLYAARKEPGVQKKTATLYGVVTDSEHWRFVKVSNDGVISRSAVDFSWSHTEQRSQILGFLAEIMNSCRKQTPSAAPTKDPERTKKEVNDSKANVEAETFDLTWVDYDEEQDIIME